MQLIKKLTVAATAIVALMTTSQASAQFRLPAPHTDQHNTLIANQRPIGVDAAALSINALAGKTNPTIDIDENDLFNYNFDSQSVAGAYSGLTVPSHRNIDVSGYVAPVRGRVTSPYGYRATFGRMHKGIDLGLHVGDTVRSAFDGKIRIAKYEGKGYGYYLVVRHDNGLETVYGHLSRFLVKPNQYVKAGEPIALGGNTGHSTGPHLHFETRFMGLAINPAAIIDFDNYVAHKDVFTFNKSTYERSQSYAPRTSAKVKATKKSGKKSKATASSKSKKKKTRKRK